MKLEKLRAEINKIDRDIVLLLGRRFDLVRKVASLKKKNNLSIEDKSREKAVLKQVKTQASSLNISISFIESIFKLIISESKRIQKRKV